MNCCSIYFRLSAAKSEPNLTPSKSESSRKNDTTDGHYSGHKRTKSEMSSSRNDPVSQIKEGLRDLPESTRKRGELNLVLTGKRF